MFKGTVLPLQAKNAVVRLKGQLLFHSSYADVCLNFKGTVLLLIAWNGVVCLKVQCCYYKHGMQPCA